MQIYTLFYILKAVQVEFCKNKQIEQIEPHTRLYNRLYPSLK